MDPKQIFSATERLIKCAMEKNPITPQPTPTDPTQINVSVNTSVPKVSGHSGITDTEDDQRLDGIYQRIQEAQLQGQLIDDVKFLYLLVQRSLAHEMQLRKQIDDLVMELLKQMNFLGMKDRVSFRTHTWG